MGRFVPAGKTKIRGREMSQYRSKIFPLGTAKGFRAEFSKETFHLRLMMFLLVTLMGLLALSVGHLRCAAATWALGS